MSKGLEFFDEKSLTQCPSCVKGKQHRIKFMKENTSRATEILEIIRRDICGPFQTHIHTRCPYFITFIDDKYYNLYVET